MKITKQKLKQIIKEESAKLSEALPPHLQSKVDAYEKKKQKFSITDVTPPGYGPDEPEEEEPLKLGTPKEDPMKRTRQGRGQPSRLRKKVMNKEGQLEEISRTPQTKYGEPSGSGSRQAVGTVKAFILDKFQEMYSAWEPQTPEGVQYLTELGDLIEKIESIAELDDKRYFQESQLEE